MRIKQTHENWATKEFLWFHYIIENICCNEYITKMHKNWFFNRQKDLEQFLDTTRMKFVGFQVKNDLASLAGLPQPIHEGVKVLKEVKSHW